MKEQDFVYAVYEERSFSKAAKKLFISQPALSIAVKKVEEELGITIFDRSATPLNLTEEGKVYLHAIEEIRSVERTLGEQLADMANLKSGHITVSGENFVSSFILPEVLMRFSQKYGGIQVDLVESNSPDLRRQLLFEKIDLLVAHDFDHDFYEAAELFEEHIYLAVPADLPINKKMETYALNLEEVCRGGVNKPPVDLNRFAEEEFLILKPGNDLCRRGLAICKEAGFSPRIRIRLDQLITAYNLCRSGMGLTFVSDILVEKTAGTGCLYYRLDSPFACRTMSIGYKKNRYLGRAGNAFIETAKETYRQRRKDLNI